MTIVLVQRNGTRTLMEVGKPEMVIRLQSSRTSTDYELYSIDSAQRFVYVERAGVATNGKVQS